MNDKELLELAAKAGGIKYPQFVSEVFNSKEDAEQWAKQLKGKYEQTN